ncbi:hypothetical protein ZIOFF_074904 [Zingiber officinale]|uniref:RRM domain-containing protein n=2 Tax=Zingiber officinale TaxID=94328 RepID=A0A8J5BUH1_ZINOF|nr:hypothetical protein ZIOFF_074904 [Zingiber officinale]
MAAGDSMPPGVDLSHPSHFPPLVAANLKPVESLPQSSQEANPVHPSSYAAALRPASPRASKKSFEDVGENFKQPSIYNNKLGIFYTKEEVNGMSKPYQFSLIGKFSGLRPRPQIVFQALKNIGLFGLYDIRFLHAGYIFLHFSSSEDMARMARVWTRGIWFIGVPKYCTQCFHLGHLEDACYANGNRPNPLWKSENDGNDGQDLSVGLNRRNAVGKQEVTGPFESDEGKKMLNKSDGGKQVWIKNGEASEQGMVDKKGSESRNSFHVLSTLEEEDKGELEGLYEPPENVMYPWGDGYVDTKIGQNQLGPLGFQNLEVEEQKLDKLEDAHLAAVLAPAHVDSQTNVLNVEPRMDKGKSVVGFSKQRSYNSIGSKKTGAVCAKSKAEGTSRGWSSSLQKQSGPVGLAGIQDSGQWGNFSFSAMQDEFEGNEVSKSFMEEDDSDYGEAVDSQRSSSFPLVSNPKGPLLKTSSINVPSGVTRMVTRSKSQFLHLKLCSPIFPISIMVTVVYAKCNRIDRRILWDDVSAVKPVMDEYWPMGRDFNVIIGSNEHSAGFLAKPGLHGQMVKYGSGWIESWFQKMWTKHQNFSLTVHLNWMLPCSGFGLQKLQIKLKRLKAHLKWWNAEIVAEIVDVSLPAVEGVSAWAENVERARHTGVMDCIVWKPSLDGRFSMKTAWQCIRNDQQQAGFGQQDGVWSAVWRIIKPKYWKGFTDVAHNLGFLVRPKIVNTISVVSWKKPKFRCFKLNADGCSKGNPGVSSYGVIVLDHGSIVVMAKHGLIGVGSNVREEFVAILKGLELCMENQLFLIWLESDSLVALKILSSSYFSWEFGNLIRKIKGRIFYNQDIDKELRGICNLDKSGLPYIQFSSKLVLVTLLELGTGIEKMKHLWKYGPCDGFLLKFRAYLKVEFGDSFRLHDSYGFILYLAEEEFFNVLTLICIWCWHHIIEMAEKDDTESQCPACCTPYDKDRVLTVAAANSERIITEVYSEKKQRSQRAKPKISEEVRKHLSGVRILEHNEYFGQYGKVLKASISCPAGTTSKKTFAGYITYAKEEEAVRCIQATHNYVLEGKTLRACFGTTKYCCAWLSNLTCSNPDCLYLHDIGNQEDSFTKHETISAYTWCSYRVLLARSKVLFPIVVSGNPMLYQHLLHETSKGLLCLRTDENPIQPPEKLDEVATTSKEPESNIVGAVSGSSEQLQFGNSVDSR